MAGNWEPRRTGHEAFYFTSSFSLAGAEMPNIASVP